MGSFRTHVGSFWINLGWILGSSGYLLRPDDDDDADGDGADDNDDDDDDGDNTNDDDGDDEDEGVYD
eukprot:2654787-Karenia_brevis.AAC.1